MSIFLSHQLMAAGEPDRAVELIKIGMRLDPLNIAQPLYLIGSDAYLSL